MQCPLRRALALVAIMTVASPIAVDAQSVQPPVAPAQPSAPSLLNPDLAPEIVIHVGVHTIVLVPHHVVSNSDAVTVTAATLDKQNNSSLSKVIEANVSGAAAAGSGEFHIRGSHGQYTYYLDGAPLPESISGSFSNLIDPKNIESLTVYTGGFPAKYGNNLAAVFDVTAKAGTPGPLSGSFSQSVSGYGTYQTTLQLEGGEKNFTYFLSGVGDTSERGLDPVAETVYHDDSSDQAFFGKFDLGLGKGQKLVLDTGYTNGNYQIPNTEAQQNPQPQQSPLPVAPAVDDTQRDGGTFANLIWTKNTIKSTSTIAIYTHNSTLKYNGSLGDLAGASVENPLAETYENRSSTYYGLRVDETQRIAARHNLGYGIDASTLVGTEYFLLTSSTNGTVGPFQTDLVNSNVSGNDQSAYIQDDWTPGRWFIDYGARFDQHKEAITTSQLSPRVNTTYTVGPHDKFHLYYDRLFQPAAVEDIRNLAGTTAIGTGTPTPVQPERDNFYETGWQHTQYGTTLGIAYYYKTEVNVIDENLVGSTFLTAPFNVQKGYARGVELTADGPLFRDTNYYINYARSWAKSDGQISGGLVAAGPPPPGWFYDDHDQTNTATVGVDYEHKGRFIDLDGEYGSGFPYGQNPAGDINYMRVEPHFIFDTDFGVKIKRNTFTISVINVLNHPYVIKYASAFTNQDYGQGRTFGVKWAVTF